VSRIWVTPEGMPRCVKCCAHGVLLAAWCGWCDDMMCGEFDCVVGWDEPQWLCPHGIGTPFGPDRAGRWGSDDFLACLRAVKP
jgi:hypothetical protein